MYNFDLILVLVMKACWVLNNKVNNNARIHVGGVTPIQLVAIYGQT